MQPTEAGTIEVRMQGHVQILTLCRPEHHNRVTQAMAEAVARILEASRADRAIAGCVLTGKGGVFCTGGDYLSAGGTSEGRLAFARAFADMERAMNRLGKPLVGAVNGNAHAGGFSLVAACDLAVASEAATLGLPEIAHGLFPFLALAIVKDSLPKKVLFDLVYRARLLSAHEARDLHLVNEVVPPSQVLSHAVELAGCTAAWHPDIVGLGRDLYYNTRCASPVEAVEQSRFALAAALKAMEEGGGRG
ncbi:enoyl-CoA hydratase/isomerase family protein [Burkholderia sp. WAC0059]|uniref:enoyl-CoA hydratase/isomerase family protein n=1 Tax=Burkholderia sp. WAC0059 TaxID=2066022 RepID=UPI0011AEE353|nr:enoyl-CoA hydratase/isomerase family protein [Burkholderia sp. WAC0059]